ncbi:DUF4282 domain-containing protein [Georgenia sp. MJ206]|uniref:DUF4282 domain-containing protein n=1 Tax=Georgenia wangjunii TaxID=3117730 RepID=UPI002F266174
MSDQPTGSQPARDEHGQQAYQPSAPQTPPPPPGAAPQAPPPGYSPPAPQAPPGYGQPGYPGQPQYAPTGYGQPGFAQPGFAQPAKPSTFAGLTDMGFTARITPALAKVAYIGVVVLAVLITVVGVITGISAFGVAGDPFVGGGSWVVIGLLSLVSGPVWGFLTLVFGRFALELFLDHAAVAKAASGRE